MKRVLTYRATYALSMIMGLLLLNNCTLSTDTGQQEQVMSNKKRVLLIGASIGQAWQLQEMPLRLKDENHIFESVAAWQYDKTDALEEILMRPRRKLYFTRTYIKGFFQPAPKLPNVIIIKECASYFPGDQTLYQELIKKWVERIQRAEIRVILATVAPVTRDRAAKREGQIESIWQFNDWIRAYAEKEGFVLLDLESALRKSPRERFLQDDLTSGDGQHLNKKAYDLLDKVLQKTLQSRT